MGFDWFRHNWMNAGFVAGLFLLAIVPVFAGAWSLPLLLVYLQIPLYMVHQLEEHTDDRFRTFINTRMAAIPDALTTNAVVVINVPLVWGVDLIALYLARFVDIGFGLVALWLTVINAIVHVVAAGRFRGYNPGLVTAVVLFLPFGIWGIIAVSAVPGVGVGYQVLGIALAILTHIAIAVHVMRRARMLKAA